MSDLLECSAEALEAALQTREDLGLAFQKVYLVTRTWSGQNIGDGTYSEKTVQITPTPIVEEHDFDLRLTEGGSIKQGDRIIKKILKSKFPNESDVDTRIQDNSKKVEILYKIGTAYYVVQHILEKALYWDVQVRRVIDAR